jgi:hypothetical protein
LEGPEFEKVMLKGVSQDLINQEKGSTKEQRIKNKFDDGN